MGFRVNVFHLHVQDTMIIMEEVTPPPPVMPPLWHFGDVGGPGQPPTQHQSLYQGIGEEEATVGRRGGPDGHGEVFQGIFPSNHQCGGLQLIWPYPHGHGRWLSGSCIQPVEVLDKWEWMLRIILWEGSNVWTSGEISTWWYRSLSSLTQRRGWLPPALAGLWGVSNTWWTAGWLGSSPGYCQTEDGITPTPYPPLYLFSVTP